MLLFRQHSEGGCLAYQPFCHILSIVKLRCDAVFEEPDAAAPLQSGNTGPTVRKPIRTSPTVNMLSMAMSDGALTGTGAWRIPSLQPLPVRCS